MVDFVQELAERASLTLLCVVDARFTVAAAFRAHIGSGGHVGDPARWTCPFALEVVEELSDRLAGKWHLAARAARGFFRASFAWVLARLAISVLSVPIEAVLALLHARVTIEEGITGEAAKARGAGAAAILRASLALFVAGIALIGLLVRALRAVGRALIVVKDQILVNCVARSAHIGHAGQTGEARVSAGELKRQAIFDCIDRVLSAAIRVCGHPPRGGEHGFLDEDLLVGEGQRELQAGVLLGREYIDNFDLARSPHIINAIDVDCAAENAGHDGLTHLSARSSIHRLKLVNIVCQNDSQVFRVYLSVDPGESQRRSDQLAHF